MPSDNSVITKNNAIELEEKRLENITGIDNYGMIHERHRIFPEVFENRKHKKILDIASGVGVVAERIKNNYNAEIICNDISPTALGILHSMNLNTISFDIDDPSSPFPIESGTYDAIIALSTIEHVYNIDNFISEIKRCLKPDGYFYLSAPNYNGLGYLISLLKTGKTFHDPLNPKEKYEFYAHLRYFTYQTLLDYAAQFGFVPEAVYLGIPQGSSKFLALKNKSIIRAFIIRNVMKNIYRFFSPRWATEPVICFRKTSNNIKISKPRKVVL